MPEETDRTAVVTDRPVAEPQQQMFTHLMASRPAHETGLAAETTLASLIFHTIAIIAVVWATVQIEKMPKKPADEQISLITIPEEDKAPPPPLPETPEPPKPEQMAVPELKGFQTLVPPDVVPPDIPLPGTGPEINESDFSGEGVQGGRSTGVEKVVTAEDISATPAFTPYTVAPELRNREDVGAALLRNYPKLLRDAGVGGQTVVWFYIDETGKVLKTQVQKSSGYPALDDAAIKVASIMRFSPAMNRDRKVKVWVAIPIEFTVQ